MNIWNFFFFLCNVAILILIFLQLLFSIKVRTSVTTAQYYSYIDSDYIIEKYKITFISVICIFIFAMLLFISHFTLYCAYTNRSIKYFKIFFIIHGFLTFFDILTIAIFLSTAEEYKDFLKREEKVLFYATDIKDEFWKAYYYDMVTLLIILIWEIILMFVLAKDKKLYGLKQSKLIRKLLQD